MTEMNSIAALGAAQIEKLRDTQDIDIAKYQRYYDLSKDEGGDEYVSAKKQPKQKSSVISTILKMVLGGALAIGGAKYLKNLKTFGGKRILVSAKQFVTKFKNKIKGLYTKLSQTIKKVPNSNPAQEVKNTFNNIKQKKI